MKAALFYFVTRYAKNNNPAKQIYVFINLLSLETQSYLQLDSIKKYSTITFMHVK